ncbi:MAG: tetratricopeptide repeat protein, partial [Caulobacteraceae bacterium]
MRYVRLCFALAAILATSTLAGQATSRPRRPDIVSADRLFRGGKFAQAGEIYARLAAHDPSDYRAILQSGRVALLSNRLGDARKWLKRAIDLRPGGAEAKILLAETYYRDDDFQRAAAALDGVDVGADKLIASQYPTLNVAKLKSFNGQTPYEVVGGGEATHLPFLKSDPLPLVSVRVDGGKPVTFFIDTGGSEVTLD